MNASLMMVDGLSLEFQTREGRVHALRDVSFSLGRGEIVGIVGESGPGKSVLSYAIMGLLDPAARISAGAIRFDSTDILGDRKTMASLRGSRLSMIFQSPRAALKPIMRAGAQLGDVLIRHRGGSAPRGS